MRIKWKTGEQGKQLKVPFGRKAGYDVNYKSNFAYSLPKEDDCPCFIRDRCNFYDRRKNCSFSIQTTAKYCKHSDLGRSLVVIGARVIRNPDGGGGLLLPGPMPSHWSASQQGRRLARRKEKAWVSLPLSHRKWWHHIGNVLVTLWYLGKNFRVEAIFTREFLSKYQSITWTLLALWLHLLCETGNKA